MTEADLRALIDSVRSMKAELQTLEIKAAKEGCPQRLFNTLSSFSNQDEGGIILFGLDESKNFEKVGVYDVHDLQKKITEQCKQMEPVVRPLFTATEKNGLCFVSAEIPAIDLAERPCYYKGRGRTNGSYKRVGESDERMTEYEIYSYEAFRKKYQDDIRIIPRCTFSSLNPSLLENYLYLLKRNKPNLSQLPDSQIYNLLSIEIEGGITLAAQWLFGFYPQSFIPQLCIIATVVPGFEVGETDRDGARFLDNKRIEGTIPDMLEDALSFVKTNMKTRTVIDPTTGKRTDKPEYPIIAVREILLNALIHRDYSVHTEGMPIQLSLFSDRLEVRNPGGLYGRLQVDQLGKVQPDTRNPIIATAMETLGLTENRYSGIPTIYKAAKEAGLENPFFLNTNDSFSVILQKRKKAGGDNNSEAASLLIEFCVTPRTRQEIADFLGLETVSYAMKEYVQPLLDERRLVMTIPEKPSSKNQRYTIPTI